MIKMMILIMILMMMMMMIVIAMMNLMMKIKLAISQPVLKLGVPDFAWQLVCIILTDIENYDSDDDGNYDDNDGDDNENDEDQNANNSTIFSARSPIFCMIVVLDNTNRWYHLLVLSRSTTMQNLGLLAH